MNAGLVLRPSGSSLAVEDALERVGAGPPHRPGSPRPRARTRRRSRGSANPESTGTSRGFADAWIVELPEPQVELFRRAAGTLEQGCAHADEQVAHAELVQRAQEAELGVTQ